MPRRSFTSVDDLSNEDYLNLFVDAAKIKRSLDNTRKPFKSKLLNSLRLAWNRAAYRTICRNNIMSCVFMEDSTRTSMSFRAAFELLGGQVDHMSVKGSSVAKGEGIRRTVQMAAMQRDLVVLRQSGKEVSTSKLANDKTIPPPLINAGEGVGEHPTQALLDMYTIWEEFEGKKEIKDLRIGLYGDLAHGRTAHSLIKLASKMGAKIVLITPRKELAMPVEYINYARNEGIEVETFDNVVDAAPNLDVIYTTRLQRERIDQDKVEIFNDGSGYGITPELLKALNKDAILMHPLPAVDEYPEELMDAEPKARHLNQAENGIWTRMALIKKIMGKNLIRPVF